MPFEKYNMNPKNKKTGDCAISPVALATGLTWEEAYIRLAELGLKLKTEMSEVEAIEPFLISKGFKVGHIKVVKGQRRPTVKSFAESNKDIIAVLRVANHLTCCTKGIYVDTWDCGDCAVYKYWYKERK